MQEKCLYWALFLFGHFQLIRTFPFLPVSANKSSAFLRYTGYQIDYALEEVDVGDWMTHERTRERVDVSLRGRLWND